ncbi:MAG: PHP domain-containing protein [Clostridia bacterium]|nr:PHP domain-containing protein [Clostridia bacterium]
MTNYADLHIHTSASDGEYSPQFVVRAAKAQGFKAIAITDHDTLDGLEEAQKTSREIGMELITGVEISSTWEEKEIHILGYLIEENDGRLQQVLTEMKNSRSERIKKMVIKLRNLGYDIQLDQVTKISGAGAIGRPHVAKVLLEKGYVTSIKEAFNKLLSPGCPAYIPRYKITPMEAINLIIEAQGIPVLAHPGVNQADNLIPFLKELGLLGIEVWHPEHNIQDIDKYYNLAKTYGLLMTGGSDWHGNNKDLDFSLGSIKIDYSLVEALKAKKNELRGK